MSSETNVRGGMRRFRNTIAIAVFLQAGWPTLTSNAQDTGLAGFNQLLFRPTRSSYGLYTIEGSRLLPKRTYSVGLHVNFAKDVTSVTTPATGRVTDIIASNTTGDFHAAVGILDFMEAGVDLPIVFYQGGTNFNSLTPYRIATIGDIGLDVKFRLLKDRPKSLGIALLSRASFPTGSRSNFTGDDGPTWEGKFIIDKRFKPFSVHANVGYRFTKGVTVLSTVSDDLITFGGGVNVPLPFGSRSWSLLAEASGQTVARQRSSTSTPVEVRGGLRKIFDSGMVVDAGGGGGVTNAYGTPAFRFFAGVTFDMARRKEAIRKRADDMEARGASGTTVYFGIGRFHVRPKDYPGLREVGQSLAWNPGARFVVEGHADSVGSDGFNRALSQKRAQMVRQYLIYFGALPGQMEVRAYGETKPAESNSTAAGRMKNRRVEVRSD